MGVPVIFSIRINVLRIGHLLRWRHDYGPWRLALVEGCHRIVRLCPCGVVELQRKVEEDD